MPFTRCAHAVRVDGVGKGSAPGDREGATTVGRAKLRPTKGRNSYSVQVILILGAPQLVHPRAGAWRTTPRAGVGGGFYEIGGGVYEYSILMYFDVSWCSLYVSPS